MSVYYTLERVNEYPFSRDWYTLQGVGQSIQELETFLEMILRIWQTKKVASNTKRFIRIRRWNSSPNLIRPDTEVLYQNEWMFSDGFIKNSTKDLDDLIEKINYAVLTKVSIRV